MNTDNSVLKDTRVTSGSGVLLSKSPRLRRIQWVALTLLVLAGFVNYLDRSTLAIANQTISQELHFTPTEMGLLLSVFSWAYAIVQLPIGGILDRFGARLTLGVGICLWSIAQGVLGLLSSLQAMIMARIALGVGEAPQFPAGAKVVSEWFNIKERGLPSGIFNMSSSLGPAISQPILTALLLWLGWRQMFITMGVLGVIVAIVWYLSYRNRSEVQLTQAEQDYLNEGIREQDREGKLSFAEWRGLFRLRVTWGVVFGYIGIIYMLSLFLTWMPAYLERTHQLTLAHAGWVASLPFLAGAFGVISGGLLVDRVIRRGASVSASRRWPICTGMVMAALFTLAAAYATGVVPAVAFFCAAMFSLNVAIAGTWSLISVAVPSRMVASLASIQNFGGYFGGAFAPVVTGIIVQQTGAFTHALVISAFIALVGAACYFFLARLPDLPQSASGSDNAAFSAEVQ
ncbi:MFS transporter [Pseudomonas sp. JDS28PS106]|uniref:MFS transporter n=1 Tax=Pseudomonas sp. JDS28PS106 TaxID=2497235 RepID=UPI002FD15503